MARLLLCRLLRTFNSQGIFLAVLGDNNAKIILRKTVNDNSRRDDIYINIYIFNFTKRHINPHWYPFLSLLLQPYLEADGKSNTPKIGGIITTCTCRSVLNSLLCKPVLSFVILSDPHPHPLPAPAVLD